MCQNGSLLRLATLKYCVLKVAHENKQSVVKKWEKKILI